MTPNDVFTPRRVPTRAMFAQRMGPSLEGSVGLQDALRDALDEVGPQGSDLRRSRRREDFTRSIFMRRRRHYNDRCPVCVPSLSFDDHLEVVLAEIVDRREVEIESDRTAEVEGGATLLTIKGSVKKTSGETVRSEAVRKPPLLALVDAMREAGKQVVVFDNFQNVPKSRHQAFAARGTSVV